MKLFIPITLLMCTSALVACDVGVQLPGSVATLGAAEAVFTQTDENTRNDPEAWFDEAETLALTGQEEIVYLEQLGALLTRYVEITNETGYPTGLNYEITNTLLGQNPKQIALMDANHPKINADGEIVDAWGTPYNFHSETAFDISIQSAGPDLLQYTFDDIVYEELNKLAEVVVLDTTDDSDDGGLSLGAAVEYTPSTFDTYETGELLPQ